MEALPALLAVMVRLLGVRAPLPLGRLRPPLAGSVARCLRLALLLRARGRRPRSVAGLRELATLSQHPAQTLKKRNSAFATCCAWSSAALLRYGEP